MSQGFAAAVEERLHEVINLFYRLAMQANADEPYDEALIMAAMRLKEQVDE